MTARIETEVRLCVENYVGQITRYMKRDLSHAEKDALWYRARIGENASYYDAVWVETREVSPWLKLEGSETRR